MVLYLKFIVILIIILLSTQPLNAETILSKGDAIEMFGMSKEQWKKNLLLGKSAGLMDFNITQDGNYKMLLRTIGLLTVTPVYEGGDNMPIQLIVESIFDEEPYSTTEQTRAEFEIDLIFVEAMQDMRPEFSVVGHMNRIESGPVTYFFTIVRKGAFPEIDLLNEKERACFLNCLNPVNQRASKPLESIKPEFVEYTKYENK